MKHCIALLLVCLLVTGIVSAISINPATLPAVKTAVPTTPHIAKFQVVSEPAEPDAKEGLIFLTLDSVPTGATVTIDGQTTPGGITPFKKTLSPGIHTFVFSHTLYRDDTITLDLKAGMPPQHITAELLRIDLGGAAKVLPTDTPLRSNPVPLSATGTFGPGLDHEAARNITLDHPVTIPGTATPAPRACPNNEWTCLTPAEAGQQFGDTHARYGNEPCGYTQSGSETVTRYCYMDVPSSGSLSPEVLRATGIKEGDDIYVLNETWIEHSVVNSSPALQKTGSADAGPLQPIFDFFSNLFGGSKKPESRLSIVGFAPQPEPPKVLIKEIAPEQGPEK